MLTGYCQQVVLLHIIFKNFKNYFGIKVDT